MSGRALVVAAHGSAEPAVNDGVLGLARRAGRRLRFDEAIAAFHLGEPSFSQALDALTAREVVVVPLLQSEGYYCRRVLPAALARNHRFRELRVRQTRAVGAHPAVTDALVGRIAFLVAAHGLQAPQVALVAHGTSRHRGSGAQAESSAREVERRTGHGTCAFFLDQEPAVEAITDHATGRDLVVLPLLIGAGRHATRDLARRLGGEVALEHRGVATGPAPGPRSRADLEPVLVAPRATGGRLLVDRPIGLDPAIEEIVVDLAREGAPAVGGD